MNRNNIRYYGYGPREGPRDSRSYKDKTIKQLNDTIDDIRYFVTNSYDQNISSFFGP